jgi:hypothetical protein
MGNGNEMFSGAEIKNHLLDYIEDAVIKRKIEIFTYRIMDNYYDGRKE